MSDESLNGVVASLIENEPKVREEIVEALQASKESNETPEASPNFISSDQTNPSPVPTGTGNGASETFDPLIHATNSDGTPRRNQDGSLSKKRGRKAGSNSSNINTGKTPQAVNVSPIDYKGMATFFSSLFFNSATGIFGPGWEPKPDERSNIESSTARYCESKGISDIPPGMMLCMSLALYALPRLNDEETHKRIRGFGEKLGLVAPKPRTHIPNPSDNVSVPATETVKEPITLNGLNIPVKKVENPLSQFSVGGKVQM